MIEGALGLLLPSDMGVTEALAAQNPGLHLHWTIIGAAIKPDHEHRGNALSTQ